MSPRPRTVHDTAILDAAGSVLARVGSERMTLAHVGAEVGLSAATLVQRFGSKRELMLSVFRHSTGGIAERFMAAIRGHESPLDALFAAAADRADPMDSPVDLANRLSFYLSQIDDPEFRALAVEDNRRAVEGFKSMLDKAIDVGELAESDVDTTQLAETIYSTLMGSLLTWSVTHEGNLKSKVRTDLDILLRPFRRASRKATVSPIADIADRRPSSPPLENAVNGGVSPEAPLPPPPAR